MKKFLPYLAIAFAATLGLASAEPTNEKCPVSGKPVDKTVTSKNVVVIGVCCGDCIAKIEKDPASYQDAITEATGRPANSKCPISGKAVDAAHTVTHNGVTAAFCCEKCVAKAKTDADAIMAKVEADTAGNAKCPVSGEEITKVVKIEQEIGFCCEKCKAKFDENPATAVKKS